MLLTICICLYMIIGIVARRLKMHSYYLDDELANGLKALKIERGIPESEQVRRAVRMWLEAEGILKPKKPQKGGRKKTR